MNEPAGSDGAGDHAAVAGDAPTVPARPAAPAPGSAPATRDLPADDRAVSAVDPVGPGAAIGRYPDVAAFEEIARIAERGLLDMLFSGDGTGVPSTWMEALRARALSNSQKKTGWCAPNRDGRAMPSSGPSARIAQVVFGESTRAIPFTTSERSTAARTSRVRSISREPRSVDRS